jgi:molecular chaperone GrpE
MPEPVTNDPSQPPTAAQPAADAAAAQIQSAQEAGKPVADALAAAKAESAANYDKFMRAVADLENFRRRTVREKDELRQLATGRVLEDLLPVLDNLGLGLAAAKQPNADLKTLVGGIDMVLTQLRSALRITGSRRSIRSASLSIRTSTRRSRTVPSPSVKEESVVTVVRTGYSLNGRLLRPAAVMVSSGPEKKS